jgi:hypothetical protein
MPSIINATTSTGLVSSADNSGSLQLATNNGTTAVTITTAQNVGVGTASPLGKFDVGGASTAASNTGVYVHGTDNASYGQFVAFRRNGSNSLIMGDAGAILGSGGGASVFYTYGANYQAFWTNGTERMRITSGGYSKFSNSGSYISASGSYHEFTNDNPATESLIVRNTSASQTATSLEVRGARNTTNNSFYAIDYYNTAATAYKFRVADSGNVTNTNGSYGTISDIKNKENIVDATPKLDKIKQLQVRNYNFIGDDLKQIGFVAQEFEQVFPSMVEQHPDRDEEGNDLGTTTKSIKTSVLVPILVKAIQELKAELDATKAEVQALKGVA